ncbi:MAG: glycosyltransferase [Candidatus Peribacteraceae bacterium]|nr:glycosyltransferase [Candidatus Peribacteraceae bacterium]
MRQEIPRIFHFIWLGSDPMPPPAAGYIEGWRRLHPDWEVRMWTDDTIPWMRSHPFFDAEKNVVVRADILRYEILARYGGVYLDVDMECVKNIDDLLCGRRCFLGYQDERIVCNAVIGAVPMHQLLLKITQHLRTRKNTFRFTPDVFSGPILVTRMLAGVPDVTLFATSVFYPFHYNRKRKEPEGMTDRTHAIHHWDGSWIPKTGGAVRLYHRIIRFLYLWWFLPQVGITRSSESLTPVEETAAVRE